MTPVEQVTEMLEKARKAQAIFEEYSQQQVDKCVRAIGKIIYDNADPLAKMGAEETGMGSYESKIAKNMGKPKLVWYRMKGVKSRGIIERDEEAGIIKVAKPIGVIGCIPPTTNPTMTPVHNGMCALKGGNAMIVCPHPRAKKTTVETCRLMREALAAVGAPVDLIQCIEEPTMELSGLVMKMCDAAVATGGPGMVKAAYSSGKPSFGVGAGNVQTIVEDDNLPEIAKMIVTSRTYDNGVLCTCEQCIHVHSSKYDALVEEIKKLGAYYVHEEEEVAKLRQFMFGTGSINKDAVGHSAVEIATASGITVPADTKLLMVKVSKFGKEDLLTSEKLCPVMCITSYEKFEDAVANAKTNLLHEGAGHSAVIHSHNKEHIEYAGEQLPVSRLGVNMIGSSGLGGAIDNNLMPTATLGCGTWGNNSISENLWWTHLVNIARIAYRNPNAVVPTDEEIWAE